MTSFKNIAKSSQLGGLCMFFLLFYTAGVFYPETWWGVHFLGYFPNSIQVLFLIICLLLISPIAGLFQSSNNKAKTGERLPFTIGQKLFITIIIVLLFSNFPISNDVYGDAARFKNLMGEYTETYKASYLKYFISPDIFHAKNGERTVLNGVQLTSYYTGWTHAFIFNILGLISGASYVLIWLNLLDKLKLSVYSKRIGLLLGLSAPFLWIFMGHFEIYAPFLTAILGFLSIYILSWKKPTNKSLASLTLLLLLCLKLHSVAFLLLPAFLVYTMFYFPKLKHFQRKVLTWKGSIVYLICPIIIAGCIVYFFIVCDYNDPRFLGDSINTIDRMFLPLYGPESPLDRYTLLHGNHIIDFINLQFVLSSASWFLIIAILRFYRKRIHWERPELVVIGTTLFIFLLFFFMVNPLLGMQLDWDLFSLPGPILIVFGLLLLENIEHFNVSKKMYPFVIVLSLLSLPLFYVNGNEKMISKRLETVGIRKFKTYWIHSAQDINYGISMDKNYPATYLKRYLEVSEKLLPYSNKEKDIEYADILWRIGQVYRQHFKDYDKAQEYHELSATYFPDYKANRIGLLETYFLKKEFKKSYDQSLHLIRLEYPDLKRALGIAIHTALEASLYNEALGHCETYLKSWPNDQNIHEVKENLLNGSNLDELKFLFSEGN